MRLSPLPLIALIVPALIAAAPAVRADPPKVEAFLQSGKLAEGEAALTEALKAAPDDDQTRFGLGVLQFLRAVEARIQGLYRHGFHTDQAGGVARSMFNLPVPINPKPEPLDAMGLRAMFRGWVDDLAKAEATLAGVKDPAVKLPLHFGLIRLDFDGDGESGDDEMLWQVYARFNAQAARQVDPETVRGFVVAFDRGDVDWLRGYCHLLMSVGEIVLAHDFEDLFNETGYLFFRGARPPHAFLVGGRDQDRMVGEILDIVAMIHMIRLKVVEPGRMTSALGHMESTVKLSRSSWKAILAENDDDHEWVPNPKQTSVVPARVTPEIVAGWMAFLDEFEKILAGTKLPPFWRGNNPKLGVNVRKVFTEPRTLDLVLWVRGTAAVPYLQEGEISSGDVWGRITRVFRGEFIGFAIWFN